MADVNNEKAERPKDLNLRMTELQSAVEKLTATVDDLAKGRTPCFECSCGPCGECSACSVCKVCWVCKVCSACWPCYPVREIGSVTELQSAVEKLTAKVDDLAKARTAK